MNPCFCNRLYNMSIPSVINEFAFSGSLCRIREFRTADGSHFCLTIFSLSDYKHLHFPHDEYKLLIAKLYAQLSAHAIFPTACNSTMMSIKEQAFSGNFKVNFGGHRLTITPLTAFNLVKTTPFSNVFSADDHNTKLLTCDTKWDICTCKTCPVFSRLIEFEVSALKRFSHQLLTVLHS